MVDVGFKYPTTVAFLGLVTTTVLSYASLQLLPLDPQQRTPISARYFLYNVRLHGRATAPARLQHSDSGTAMDSAVGTAKLFAAHSGRSSSVCKATGKQCSTVQHIGGRQQGGKRRGVKWAEQRRGRVRWIRHGATRYPLTGCTSSTLNSFLYRFHFALCTVPPPLSPAQVMPTGFMMALTFQCGNGAYLHLTVAFVQVMGPRAQGTGRSGRASGHQGINGGSQRHGFAARLLTHANAHRIEDMAGRKVFGDSDACLYAGAQGTRVFHTAHTFHTRPNGLADAQGLLPRHHHAAAVCCPPGAPHTPPDRLHPAHLSGRLHGFLRRDEHVICKH